MQSEVEQMISVFDVVRISRIDHTVVNSHQLVITDENGKPNGLLTDLLRMLSENQHFHEHFFEHNGG